MSEAASIRIGREPIRSRRLSSNSVLLQGPARFVVVDAGGEPALFRSQLEEIRRLQPSPPRPVCIALTHAHIDHIAGLTEAGELPDPWPYEIAAHAQCLRALRAADRTATLAELTGRPLTPFYPSGWIEWRVASADGASAKPELAIPLGGGQMLEAYCTPGHCPDHVCWRIGSDLFAGDLLAATAPLVAGIPGWDRDALLASLCRLELLVAAQNIRQVHVGHGRPLDRAAVAAGIARSRREAGELGHIAPVDVYRVQRTVAGAVALFTELDELCDEIARRIGGLADKLAQIQESRVADEVRAIDRSREMGNLLDAFAAFKSEAEVEGRGALGVAAKGVQTVLRISELLGWEKLDLVLDESFLRFARTRLVDSIQLAKGLAPANDAVGLDLGGRLQAYVQHLQEQQSGACQLDNVSGGEEGFRRQLLQCLARTPSLGPATIRLAPTSGTLPVRMDPVRFFDALTRLIECQVARGATDFALQAERSGTGPVLTLGAGGPAWEIEKPRATVWERVFARGGARMDFPAAGTRAPLVLEFDAG